MVEDRLILYDLRGVNLRVNFFLGTREEWLKDTACINYSLCWRSVDVLVDQLTVSELIPELDFFYTTQRLIVDDQVIAGDILNFRCEKISGVITASCTILLGRGY